MGLEYDVIRAVLILADADLVITQVGTPIPGFSLAHHFSPSIRESTAWVVGPTSTPSVTPSYLLGGSTFITDWWFGTFFIFHIFGIVIPID